MPYNPNSPANMASALSKAAQRGSPGLAGSTGFPKGGPGKNSPQFKPVTKQMTKQMVAQKVANAVIKSRAKLNPSKSKSKTFSATKFNNQKAKTFGLTK